jgi:hypothetical protein
MESKIGLTAGPEYGGPEMLDPSTAASFEFWILLLFNTNALGSGAKAVVACHIYANV